MKRRSNCTLHNGLIQDINFPPARQPASTGRFWRTRFAMRFHRRQQAERHDAVFSSTDQTETLESIRSRLRKRSH